MRIDLDKCLLIGPVSQREAFFKEAQRFGILEFLGPSQQVGLEYAGSIDQLRQALKIVRRQPETEQRGLPLDTSMDTIMHRILDLDREQQSLEEELKQLDGEELRMLPLGRFQREDLHWIEQTTGRRIRFFYVTSNALRRLTALPEGLIHVVTAFDLAYFVGLLGSARLPAPFVEMEGVRSFHLLQREAGVVRGRLHRLRHQLEELAAYRDVLRDEVLRLQDQRSLTRAAATAQPALQGKLFATFAWVPQIHRQRLYQLAARFRLVAERVAPDPEERIPTYLQNHGLQRVGQDLVEIYDTPSVHDLDPSGWVLWAFALFFAMIVNDAGYGLVFLLAGLTVQWRCTRLPASGKRGVKLLVLLASCCIVWGLSTHSVFGIAFARESAWVRYSPIQWLVHRKADYHLQQGDAVYQQWVQQRPLLAQASTGGELVALATTEVAGRPTNKLADELNSNLLLELALLIGAVHLSLGFLLHLKRNWAGLGWTLAIWGGFLWAPNLLRATSLLQVLFHYTPATIQQYGLEAAVVGVSLACILAVAQRRLYGLGEISNLIGVLSDVLSYLRLYALGMAGSIVAATVNELGPKVGLFAGSIVVLLGHIINMGLAVMSGVIHGLRLNFLEWYHTGFEGEGRPFKPLCLLLKR